MIHFPDPVLQAQYEGLRNSRCRLTSHGHHCLRSVTVKPSWWRRRHGMKYPIHWRCEHCPLDEPRRTSGGGE